MFLKNAWYVACMPQDIDDKPLGRKVCDEQIVFYRGPGGVAAALEDFCPHRGTPLSLGQVVEGKLVCGYHGLEMGTDGKTISMPCQRVQAFPRIRTYPVVERHGFIWVWPGDAAKADPAAIHDAAWADSPEWAYGGGLFHIGCDYRLLVDNLMDLTHETYVHTSSIGQREIDEAAPTTSAKGDHVTTSRFMHDVKAPPFWQMALRGNHLPDDQLVDRWQVCHFTPPSHVMLEVGVALAGNGGYEAESKLKAASIVVNFITPETENSVWYFWGIARNFNPQDKALTASIRDGQHKIVSEDLQVLQMQQRSLAANPGRPLIRLNIDAGGVRSRQVLERVVAQERGAPEARANIAHREHMEGEGAGKAEKA
jgi:vanillate O-demethylase monooxygenase subunit